MPLGIEVLIGNFDPTPSNATVDLTTIEGTDLITQIKDLYRPSINPKEPTVTYDDK